MEIHATHKETVGCNHVEDGLRHPGDRKGTADSFRARMVSLSVTRDRRERTTMTQAIDLNATDGRDADFPLRRHDER